MNEIRFKSMRYPKTDREYLKKTEESNSPIMNKHRDSVGIINVINSSTSEATLSRTNFKQQLVSLKTLPKSEYKSRLQSLLSNLSIPPSPLNSFSSSPRGRDSLVKSPDRESLQVSIKNVVLKPLYTIPNCLGRAGYKIHNSITQGHNTSVLIKANFHNIKGEYLFCLSESHGPDSPKLVNFLKQSLLSLFEQHIHIDLESISSSLNTFDEFFLTSIKNSEINLSFTGCSLLTILVFGDSCFISNVGSCQAVLAKYTEKWSAKFLNRAHNLKNPSERSRIQEFGGKIQETTSNERQAEKFDLGGSKNPRFLLTRAFGDFGGKPIGITSKPELKKFKIKPEDKFIIMANSAFWETISPQEAVEVTFEGWSNKRTDICCDNLVKLAESRRQENSLPDLDLAVTVMFFNN